MRTGGTLVGTGLTVLARGRPILGDIHLSVRAGERLAIVGPNGAGKSTLLRVMTGVAIPASGSVELDGQPMAGLGRKVVARRIAVVPELVGLPFAMPVQEVVALGRLPHEPPLTGLRPEDHVAVDDALERVGISRLRHRDIRELSMGERQLVFIAVAIAQAAPILILDEPTAHLDIRHQVDVMQLLASLNAQAGTTVVAVLHDLALAAHFFPRIVVMSEGRIVVDGPPATALDAGRIRAVFGVDPALVRLPVMADA